VSFLHPILAWGMLLGVIPIIIYIIFRRRYRVVRWAAMEILLRAVRKRYRNVRLQDLILMALRVLALVAVAMAVARPVWSWSSRSKARGARSLDAVVVLDTSYSMGTNAAARTRMEFAKKRAQELLSALPETARVGVVYMNEKAVRATEGLVVDHTLARSAIDAATVTAAGTDAMPAVAMALEMLKGSSAASKRVLLVTDGQARAFDRQADKLRQLLVGADPSIRFVLASTPAGPVANLTLSSLRTASRWFRVGAPIEFEAVVQDMGEVASAQGSAELWVDGRKVDRKPVALTDRKGGVSFRYTFTAAGVYGVEVRLDSDAVETDNHRYTAVCIPASMDLAVVTADKASPDDSAFVFVDAALSSANESSPDVPGLPWVIRPRLTRDRLASELDGALWTVVLADPGPLPTEAVQRLAAFVRSGGALLVSAGPEATATFGSLRSGHGEAGNWMSDLTLAPAASAPADGDQPVQLQTQLVGPAILDVGSPGVRESLSAVHVFQALSTEPLPQSRWSVALRFTDARPAVLVCDPGEARRGRGDDNSTAISENGRMAIWTSSLDATWCDLPYRPAFVPLLQDLLCWLNQPRLIADSILPGEDWLATLPGVSAGKRVSIDGWRIVEPDGNRLDASLFAAGANPSETAALRVDRTNRPGVYRLVQENGRGRELPTALQTVAVNVDTRESDPAVWSQAQFRDLFPAQRFDFLGADDPLDAVRLTGPKGSEIWPVVAGLLLAILVVETLLAYRFSYQKAASVTAAAGARPATPEGATT
jgi:hypothetical protein